MRSLGAFILMVLLSALLTGCAEKSAADLNDGYFSAEAADFDAYGWKEFVTIYVKGGRIVTIEYNAKNASGFIKSWDTHYMRNMDAQCHTYPNEYARHYVSDLLNSQNPDKVDAITGATHSYTYFQALADAAIAQAKEKNPSVSYVDLPVFE